MKNRRLKSICMCIVFGVLFLLFVSPVIAAKESSPDYKKISEQIAEDVEKYHIPGMAVMVVDKDSVLFQETYGNCDSIDTPFIIGSMSKSFTALAIMQLVEHGKIELDSSIGNYINISDYFEDMDNVSKVTVRHLLNQTSGLSTYQRYGEMKVTDTYGQHVYANVNYGLLGDIIESVSGQSYEDYVTEHIFMPLGMNCSSATLEGSIQNGLIDGYRNYFGIPIAGKPDYPQNDSDAVWIKVSAGYLSSSASDMGKYLQMYLNGGNAIISEKSINSMFYDNVSVDDGSYYYGMGWNYSTEMFSQTMLWHAGLVENYTSNMFILPDRGIAAVVLVNMNDYLVCNNLIGNVVNPLLGEERQDLPDLYVVFHLLIDTIYLLLCVISIWSLITIKRWNKKEKKKCDYVIDCLRHIILPVILFCVPVITGTPIWILWLFVKDLCIVLYVNAGLLVAIGIYKFFCLWGKSLQQKQRLSGSYT